MSSGFNDKKNGGGDKKIKDLLQEILGGNGKVSKEIVLITKMAAKMFVG